MDWIRQLLWVAFQSGLAPKRKLFAKLDPHIPASLEGAVASMRASAAITQKSAIETSVQQSCHMPSSETLDESLSVTASNMHPFSPKLSGSWKSMHPSAPPLLRSALKSMMS